MPHTSLSTFKDQMNPLSALALSAVWSGQPSAPANLRSWQTWDALCWLKEVGPLAVVERYQWLIDQLDLWSSRARLQPERLEECRAAMLPIANEALAIKAVL